MLRSSMQAADVMETLDLARAKTGVDQVRVVHRPRLLSDNGPCYVSGELADYLETHQIAHTRGAPYHPMNAGQDRTLSPLDNPRPAVERGRRGRSSALSRMFQLAVVPG